MNDTTTTDRPAGANRGRRGAPVSRTTWIVAGAVAVVAVLLMALFAVILRSAFDDDDSAGRGDRVVSGPRGNLDRATFELLTGVTSVTVRAADLGDTLYRIETPAGGSQLPRVTADAGRVRLELVDSGLGGASAVEIRLNSALLWSVRLVAGATSHVTDLGAARVAGVEYIGGAQSIDLTLPKPSATVTVRMAGGVNSWALHLPNGVPARVQIGSGAGTVSIDGTTRTGLSGGDNVSQDGWDAATDRYLVEAAGGASSIAVDHR